MKIEDFERRMATYMTYPLRQLAAMRLAGIGTAPIPAGAIEQFEPYLQNIIFQLATAQRGAYETGAATRERALRALERGEEIQREMAQSQMWQELLTGLGEEIGRRFLGGFFGKTKSKTPTMGPGFYPLPGEFPFTTPEV